MGMAQENINATADRILTLGVIDIDGINLAAASVTSVTPGALPAGAYVEIGIMHGGTTVDNRILVLASGYVGDGHSIGWTGLITGTPSQFLYAEVRSTDGDTFRLTALSE